MKINLLYLLIPAAVGSCIYIMQGIQGQSTQTFFGTAETEPTMLNMDMDVEVQRLLVRTGQEVKAGDTLAILVHRKLDDEAFALSTELSRTAVEQSGNAAQVQAQMQKSEATYNAKIADLESEIALIKTSDSLQQGLNARLFPGVHGANKESEGKIAALKNVMTQEQILHQRELDRLRTDARVSTANTGIKQDITRQKQDRQAASRARLVLLAPVSGYIDQLNIQQGALVPAYRDMLRIYPVNANKVIGFVHENAKIPFRIGDEVTLTSSSRPTEVAQGKIVAVSPKLVELPLRLRKFIEVRAWGRELMIQPTENTYYIGEKITIALKAPAQ